ncbi:MAG: DUF2723 domain-containing protein [Bacteroidales bacterium]|nr:DUF2723 domain-containing protein [Bacteroidales bacterium]
MEYKKLNILFGWLTFIIASLVYISTIEPTASFWDCGEFIATSYKLEVGHPPGAPFFMLIARFFSLFAFGDVTKVAMMVNILSALASSFTILFLFWTITHLAKKIVIKDNDFTTGKTIAIIGSAFVGALAYTFSDTFWFSAVEGEVYATSSLFTAFLFWAILKWENIAHEKYANRWLILIAYLMGLSIGVHLLGLLAIPAIVFVYYFKMYKTTKRGIIYAAIVSVIILGTIMYGIIPGIVKIASVFELIFINGFGLPYNTGVIIFILLLFGGIVWGIYYTWEKQKVLLNTILLVFTVILIGYSSYAIIIIRSNANPPIDQNNPDNVFDLLSYLNREQYGERPLMTGQYFNAPLDRENPNKQGKKNYIKKDGKYIVSTYSNKYNYDKRFTTIFPRMYSAQANHVSAYKAWTNFKGRSVRIINNEGESEVRKKPSFGENLKFFFKYQLVHMYFRYFMWNYAGRQNDIQGHGEITKGNWLCGIKFIDEARIGPQDNLPKSMTSNKAMNKLYMLPFILGLIGLFFHYSQRKLDFSVVFMLFFFTGIAIVIYLNQTPEQPRERDYAYAGSFYAFAIWIGLGVLGIYNFLQKKAPATISAIVATIITLGLVPGIMAKENLDDHNRSNRYTARDYAYNYLNSCAPNAILFTNGDNDTFPLWYAQEVEGIRTDVRVICLPYLSTDWYIDQMTWKAYESEPINFTMKHEQYIQGERDVVPIYERIKETIDLQKVIDFVADDNPKTKIPLQRGNEVNYIPARKVRIPVDSAKVVANKTVQPEDTDKIVSSVEWRLSANYLGKNDMMILDLIATNNWERPVYFVSAGHGNSTNLKDYFQLEGFAYRLVPIKTKYNIQNMGRINTNILYNNYMNKFKWGNISNNDVYLDENNLRTTRIIKLRGNFARLAEQLIIEGKIDSAKNVMNKCMSLLSHEKEPFNYFDTPFIESLYKANETEKANQLVEKMVETADDDLNYYLSLPKKYSSQIDNEKRMAIALIQRLTEITGRYKQTELNKKLEEKINSIFSRINLSTMQ